MDIVLCLISPRPLNPDIFTFSESISPFFTELEVHHHPLDDFLTIVLLVFQMPIPVSELQFLHFHSQVAEST